ncbi:hypothetical protein B0H17DRAFT_1144470 [Mycena rosella]|uniref:Uncharacterized protein n=1 Tax=Mycena rosella TaxID=1033263 RepID=A0AAD7CSN3_MYCRO|nr:hypothetical protein B0H17DRAFT_1144470 [Mycena rosella]
MNLSIMPHNLVILAKFPSLRILQIQGWGTLNSSGLDAAASGLLLLLKRYTGPISTLHIFLPLPTLTHLKTSHGYQQMFIAQLRQLPTPSNITTLSNITTPDVCFAQFEDDTVAQLASFFVCLTDFRIGIIEEPEADAFLDGINPIATSFFQTLTNAPNLPQALQSFALSWEFEYEGFEDAIPTCGKLPDVVMTRCWVAALA